MEAHFTHWNRESVYDSIRELAFAFQKSRLFLTAMELDVFSVIGEDGKTSEQVSNAINADKKAVDRLLNALCGIELIKKKDNKYFNQPYTLKYLVSSSPEYMEDLKHYSNLWNSWTDLTEAVKIGKPVVNKEIHEKSDDWIRNYYNSTHYRAKNEAPQIIKQINLKNVKNVLELGCGSAQYTIEILKTNPDIRATVMDIPKITDLAKQNILKENMTDRIEVISGDFFTDKIGKGYDMIILSYVIHSYSVFENIEILQKCYEALNKHGQILINENIIEDNRITPVTSSIFSLNMLLNTKSGDSYSETDVWIMLKEAWFKDIFRINTEFESTLMVGLK